MSNNDSKLISPSRKAEYKKIYDTLTSRAVGREYIKGFYEKHHIIPRSMGGSNEKTNIAILTYREHFLAHWLLTKFVEGDDLKKMLYALYYITKKSKDNHQRIISSWQFKKSREVHHKAIIGNIYSKGHRHTNEALKKISDTSKGNKYAKGHRFKYTEEQCLNRSKRMFGNQNGK